ncbi:MAG: proton-conducting transporter membrane subunit [Candidatus Delongbacteria bacterium]
MALALILAPLLLAALAWLLPAGRRPWLLPLSALVHALLIWAVLLWPDLLPAGEWLALDAPGRLVLLLISVLDLSCGFYAVGYLKRRTERPNRVFVSCLTALPGAMALAILAQHLGLLWVAVEATALFSAPLIWFNRTPRSIEATWKYLLVGSVGIALALLGTFFLAYSSFYGGGGTTLTVGRLLEQAPLLSRPWLRAAYILLLVGYGTKMGLAPMHTWKPDAYGEAAGVVGATLAAGVTACAFLALLRVTHLCQVAGEGPFVSRLLLVMGLFSMAVAGVFMIGQRDLKRLLAWSSVEHMGILALGLGLGKAALWGTLLHVLANGLGKGVLFLSAGNIHRVYASKQVDEISGVLRRMPVSGSLFLAGFIAITGSPPFAPFISEFSILRGAFQSGQYLPGALFLGFLLMVFLGMGATVLRVVQGPAPRDDAGVAQAADVEDRLTVTPILVLMALVLLLGLWIPAPLQALLEDAVRYLEVPA